MTLALECPEGTDPALIDEAGAPLACVAPDGLPFTLTPPPAAPVLDCPEGTVPGWLDETGAATGCVGDLPDPGVLDEAPTPAPVVTADPSPEAAPAAPVESTAATPSAPVPGVDVLAETGADPVLVGVMLVAALAALVGGSVLARKGARS